LQVNFCRETLWRPDSPWWQRAPFCPAAPLRRGTVLAARGDTPPRYLLPSVLPSSIPGSHFARNLVDRRTLLFQLVRRDFTQRYAGSAAGWLWSLIHPLVLLASYTFIFSVCLKQPAGSGELTRSYPLFLFAGMLPWLLFSDTVSRSGTSIVEHANLVTKTMFPSEIVPVSIFLSSAASHLPTVLLFIAVVAITQGHANAMVVLLPAYLLFLGMFAVGVGWIVAALQVYLRDTAQVVSVVLTFWMWITPLFIDEKRYDAAGVGLAVRANPLAYLVRAYRVMLLGSTRPSFRDLAAIAAAGGAAFLIGGMFFRRMKKGFADVL